MEIVFWIALVILVYVYLGYPAILLLLPRQYPRESFSADLPSVALFIPAHNEAAVIRGKLENSLALDYPQDRLEVVVASDASTDDTAGIVREFSCREVALFEASTRCGKNALINQFLPRCLGDILIFTDANSYFHTGALKALVQPFADRTVGCVVGHLKYTHATTAVGPGEGLYFRYEAALKALESKCGTLVAATGSIYAIRRDLFEPLDLDVPNDFAHPIQIAAGGYKVVFEPAAVAYEKATTSPAEEFRRRARIVNRSVTAFLRYWRSHAMLTGLRGFCFVSHKLLRWLAPLFLVAVFLANLALHPHAGRFYTYTLYAQVAFYSLAVVGLLLRGKAPRIFTVPLYFCLVNAAAVAGIARCLTKKRELVWDAAATTR